ncbi:MAG: hypothetical protein A2147_11540 [Chloroflexi bacterium RBG_16_57_8]|nr:MAG: hypothetical protein A2147_11540 [Chloroflexi bacterium RBG_16_57_8]
MLSSRRKIRILAAAVISISAAGAVFAANCRWEPWTESRPSLSEGERYEAVVPDTLDFAHRAELAIGAVTGTVDVDEPANGEIWFNTLYCTNPAYMMHAYGTASVMQPKAAEPLPALRLMTGSALNLPVEKKMVDWIISCLSPEDGLIYSMAKPDRPWYAYDCELVDRFNNKPGTQSAGKRIPVGDQDYAYIYGQARALKFMVAYYQYTRDPAWKKRIDKMIEGLDKKMCWHNTDPATGKRYAFMPIGGGVADSAEFYSLGSCMPRSGWRSGAREPKTELESGNEGSVFMDIGPFPGVLAQWYRMTGNKNALELADEFVNYMMMKKFWGTDKDALGRDRGAEIGHWEGHFYGRMEALKGLIEYAIVTNNTPIKEFARGGYDWARNTGTLWSAPHRIPIPSIGYFGGHCGCSTPRMVALALRLMEAGMGDYWEDVDRCVRNNMIENQTNDPELIRGTVELQPSAVIRPVIDCADRVVERGIGGFSSSCNAESILLLKVNTLDGYCCLTHGCWGLYYAWDAIVHCDDNGVSRVNLLLNRASPWMDIDSYIPYEGKVVVRNKTAKVLFLRIPAWADKKAVRCSRNGKPAEFIWDGNYILLTGLKKKDVIAVEFPMVECTEKHRGYTITFKGNTVVDLSPRNKLIAENEASVYPIYRRDYLKADKAPMKKVTRYVSPGLIKW